MNFEFSNPLRINELFRPILQFLVVQNAPKDIFSIKKDVIKRIKNTYKKYDPKNNILDRNNIDIQVEKIFEESLDLLISNKLINIDYPKLDVEIIDKQVIAKSDPLFYLTDKAKIHIQSEESIKFINAKGETLYILDFLP